MQMTVDALLAVLSEHDDWVEAQVLADAFRVTTRTVRAYVRKANDGRQVIESSHRGYRLMSNVDVNITSLMGERSAVRRDDRLLVRLLSRPGAQNVYDLAESLHVSDSSLSALLRTLRPRLAEEELFLEKQREFVWIEGAERNKRRLIRRVMRRSSLSNFSLSAVECSGKGVLRSCELRKLVKRALDDHGLACGDFGLDNLVAHLEIMENRISLGLAISDEDLGWAEVSDISQSSADEICSMIEDAADIDINSAERFYIALIVEINARRCGDNARGLVDQTLVTLGDLRIAREAADLLSWTYCLDGFSEEFIQRFAAHVHLLLRRMELGMEVPNPLVETVKADYPFIYDMAVRAAEVIEGASGCIVSEDEIAFLAFHIGGYLSQDPRRGNRIRCVVLYLDYCELGSALVRRVDEVLGNRGEVVLAERVADYSPLQIACDLVVTTAHVDVPSGVCELIVGPMMSDSDERRLFDCVEDVLRERRGHSTAAMLRNFIRPDLVRFSVPTFEREEVIRLLAADCERKGLVGEGFADEVLERERLSPTAFNNLVAIPHSLHPSAMQPFLYLVISEQSITWGEQRVSLVLLLGIPPHERKSFMNLYSDLISALADPINASSLLKSASYEEAIAKLEGIIRHERV